MDFHLAFREIDADDSGEITRGELEAYMRAKNYAASFVEKWLNLFDMDGNGRISYEEYCTTLGLVPAERKKSVIVEDDVVKPQASSKQSVAPTPQPEKHRKEKPSKKVRESDVARHSRSDNFRRKGLWRHVKKVDENAAIKQTEEQATGRRPRRFNPEEPKRKLKLRPKKCFSDHKRRLRAGITPGTVLILLTGLHRGKRVVFLKQLASGLLLVTGPFKFNGVPLRRVHQKFVIVTSTKLALPATLDVPERVNDDYFRRSTNLAKKQPPHLRKKLHKKQQDLFQKSPATDTVYNISAERKQDQKTVDQQVVRVISQDAEKGAYLKGYLGSKFGLFKHDYPHQIRF